MTDNDNNEYVTPPNIEKQHMATLLQCPDLAREYLPLLNETHWHLTGNVWIWSKYQEHLALHHTPPTLNILTAYTEHKEGDSDRIAKVAACELLNEYQNQAPLDAIYFRQTMLNSARNTKLKQELIPALKDNDWQGAQEIIQAAYRSSHPLPEALNLKTLMAKPSNDEQNLLNEWAFERQAILAIVAPTGIGKSVLTMQLATHLACGKHTVGFVPHKAYKVLVIQNEDSDNDIAMMKDGAFSQLSDSEKEMVYANLSLIRLRGSSGKAFLLALDTYCHQFKPDIVFINPLLKYFGGDPLNSKEVSTFLNEFEPIIERHNCGAILIHHTIKQSKQSRMNQADTSYSGFGSSVWSNSVRDTVEIRPAKLDGYYKLITGKRSSKWGWRERFIQRSDDRMLPYWFDAADMDVKQIEGAEHSAANENKADLLERIPCKPDTASVQELMLICGLSDKTVRNHLKSLLVDGAICADDARGNAAKRYSRNAAKEQ